jgi:hypothetical protein
LYRREADTLPHPAVLLQNYNETATCFTYPTTAVFSLVFISPVVFHHILLGMTLWKSAEYIKRSGQGVGLNPILHVIRRDHILFTLAICLINFTNLVLSLQPGSFPYKLVRNGSPVRPALLSNMSLPVCAGQSAASCCIHANLPGKDCLQPEGKREGTGWQSCRHWRLTRFERSEQEQRQQQWLRYRSRLRQWDWLKRLAWSQVDVLGRDSLRHGREGLASSQPVGSLAPSLGHKGSAASHLADPGGRTDASYTSSPASQPDAAFQLADFAE